MRLAHHRGVFVVDAVLPAAAHLTGRHSKHVLSAALDAVGGTLESSRPCHLHYRPGHHIVVRFDSRVRWAEQPPVVETLVAATTVNGPPPGTLPVEATTDDGETLEVGVWRWPFDPVLTGLGDAVTPSAAASFLDGASRGRLRLSVVAYRPTQRAVVRAVDDDDTVFYLKAVRPKDVAGLVDRHRRMFEAGVPVPEVLNHDAERGLIAMAALRGLTIRERMKRRHSAAFPVPISTRSSTAVWRASGCRARAVRSTEQAVHCAMRRCLRRCSRASERASTGSPITSSPQPIEAMIELGRRFTVTSTKPSW